MSKKLCSTPAWKAYLLRRQQDELKKKRHRELEKRLMRNERRRSRSEQKRTHVVVRPPAIFSITRNPDAVIAFLRNVKSLGAKHHLTFDLGQITEITTEAITALNATISQLIGIQVRGNLPSDPGVNEILLQSGFFDHVRRNFTLPSVTRGKIARKQSKIVEARIAADLIHCGTAEAYGAPKRQYSTFRVLIESMANTVNHAAGESENRETWWASVYAEHASQRVCYTFLDNGVGIFRSVNLSPIRKFFRKTGIRNNALILEDILQGKIPSRTGLSYRGKGLPSIYGASVEGRVRSLIIVSNDVYANISKGEYRILNTQFPGTLLYWEA